MDKIDFIKMTKEDLKNFNLMVAELKQLQKELLLYEGQEEKFKNEIEILNREITKYKCTLEIMKLSIDILSPIEQEIIVCTYFEKMCELNVAQRLNVSKKYITVHKRDAIKKLSELMYGYLEELDINTLERLRVKPYKNKKANYPIYQYSLDGIFIHKWDSASQCADMCNYNADSLRNACNGRAKTFKGYRWSYVPV